jgi:type II secretory pathway pseudopilin PulG
VVIAIIGILATIAVVALQNARAKARDARRVADVKQIQTALELFFNDKQRYPTTNEFKLGSIFSTSTQGTTTYMSIIPTPPSPADGICTTANNKSYGYLSSGDGSTYTIAYCLGGNVAGTVAGPKCANQSGVFNVDCTPVTFAATGGTITTSGLYTIHTFTGSGTFTPNSAGNIEILVVAGGGAGGYHYAGGGGAGGLVSSSSYAVSAQAYDVTIGDGGAPAGNGGNGGNSVFGGITAYGGGGGAFGGSGGVAGSGGSGGGGSSGGDPGGIATPAGQGNNGAGGASLGWNAAPGGGGCGAAGHTTSGYSGGAGGIGCAYSISGSSIYYAGGGGGTGYTPDGGNGAGGTGGGGTGGSTSAGTANTGGGGGGGAFASYGLAGGSGVVIIRYLTPSN